MPNPLIVAPVKFPVGLLLPRTTVTPFAGTAEPLAAEHWRFGSANPTLAGLKSSLQLARTMVATITSGGTGYTSAPTVTASDGSIWLATVSGGAVTTLVCTVPTVGTTAPTLAFSGGGASVQATATVTRAAAPTINANSLVLGAGGRGNGLSLPFLGSASQTIWMVVKKAVAGSAQMVLSSADSSITSGQAMWKSSGTNNYLARAAGMGSEGTGVVLGSPGSDGDWIFMAASFDGANGRRTLLGSSTTTTTAGTLVPAANPLAIGNANWSGFASVALEVAELGIVQDQMSIADLQAIRSRAAAYYAALSSPITLV